MNGLFAAEVSGRYELVVRDNDGFVSHKKIDILPDVASKIRPTLSTNIVQTGDNISTHLYTLEDQLGNPASREVYRVKIDIEGAGLVFEENKQREIEHTLIE